jgi:hypothetical protein
MRMQLNRFHVFIIAVTVSLCIGTNPAFCDNVITYRLLPGSNFTPMYTSVVTGPTQNITGTFTWEQVNSYTYDYTVFNATDLHFQSQSYSFNLNTTSNDLKSNVWYSINRTAFSEVVNATGIGITTGQLLLGLTWGTYTGPAISPTSLSYSNLELWSTGTYGYRYGKMTLYAEQIPEPATLLLFGLASLALRRKR